MFEFYVEKITERCNRTQTKLIANPHKLCRFLATLGIEVLNLLFASDIVVWASWRYTAEEQVPTLRHTNEFVGAFVACGGRMNNTLIYTLEQQALYCDTDSVIFVQKDCE